MGGAVDEKSLLSVGCRSDRPATETWSTLMSEKPLSSRAATSTPTKSLAFHQPV